MRTFLILIFATLVIGLLPAKADWQPQAPRFEGIESAELRKIFKDGPFDLIRRRTDKRLPMVTSGIIIEAEPAKVWAVLIDYEKRPEIVTGVSKIKDLKWEGNKATLVQYNFIKFSFIKFDWKERRIYMHYPQKRIVFYEVDKPNEAIGGYELIPMDNGKATLLLYSVVADLRNWGFPVGTMARSIPLIEEILITSATVMIVTGVRDYVEKSD